MHETAFRIDAGVRLHAEGPRVALLRRRHLGFALLLIVLRGGRRGDQRRVHDRAATQQFALRRQVLGDAFENRLREIVAFEQMAEVEDRRLVGNRVLAEFEPCERAHRLDVVERLLGAGVGESVPLLQAIDAQHGRHRERSPPTLRPHFRIVRLDEPLAHAPRHDCRHLPQENIALRALLLRREVERRKAQLVGHRQPPRINGISVPCLTGFSDSLSMHLVRWISITFR